MKPTILVLTIFIIINAGVCAKIGVAHANAKTVILISGPQERIEIDRLRDTINAHMSDLGAELIVRAVMDMPADPETQKDVSRALLQEASALAAVWIEYNTDTLMVLVKDQNSEQILDRPVAEYMKMGDQIYDAVASMVRAALTPWFAQEVPEIKVDKSPLVPNPEDTASVQPKETTPPKKAPRIKIQGTLLAAYTLVANLDGPIANGGMLGAGIYLFRRLTLGADLRLLQAVDMNVPDRDVRLFRMPVRFKAAISFETGPLALGLEAGVTLDIARVLGVDAAALPHPIDRIRVGITPTGFIRYFATKWLSIDLLLTVDIFYEPHYYRWDAGVVFTNGKIQPSGAVGISFFVPRARKELER